MKTTKLFLLLIAFATISLTSCKKDEPEPVPTKTELITNGVWILKSAESYEDGTLVDVEVPEDIISVNFKDDHTGVTARNGIDDIAWVWQFTNSETKLTVTSDDTEFYDIDKLTSSKLQLSTTETIDGIVYKYITYLEK